VPDDLQSPISSCVASNAFNDLICLLSFGEAFDAATLQLLRTDEGSHTIKAFVNVFNNVDPPRR